MTLLGSRDTYRLGLIEAGETWMLMLQDRNLTSNIYNRATADTVSAQILQNYLPCFRALLLTLQQRLQQEGG